MSRRRGDEMRSSGSTLQLAMPLHATARWLLDIPRERGRDQIRIPATQRPAAAWFGNKSFRIWFQKLKDVTKSSVCVYSSALR